MEKTGYTDADNLNITWFGSLFVDGIKSADEKLIKSCFYELGVPEENMVRMRRLLDAMVATGFMDSEDFVRDLIFWGVCGWPTEIQAVEYCKSVNYFAVRVAQFTPDKKFRVKSMSLCLVISFDGLIWNIGYENEFDINEANSRGKGIKNIFKIPLTRITLSRAVDEISKAYCSWVEKNRKSPIGSSRR
jgi:hypothetical protein